MPRPIQRPSSALNGIALNGIARAGLVLAGLLLAALPSRPALADDVYLANGESFEGVAAEVTRTQVRILMAGGELRLPRSLVLRIEESEAPYRDFLDRKAQLEGKAGSATAGEWLELAEWALSKGLPASARTAGRIAADLDPDLPRLPPLMRRLGYARDGDSGPWVPRGRVSRRSVPVAAGGAGQPDLRHQISDEIRQAAREARQREEEIAAARREAAAEVRRVFEEARPADGPGRSQPGIFVTTPVAYTFPVGFVVVQGGIFSPGPAPPPSSLPASRPPLLDALERQPGSLLPGHLDLRP